VANVGVMAQALVTYFVHGPWTAFMIGLNSSASGSASSRTAPDFVVHPGDNFSAQ
jgi:hypothetical protein